MPLINNRYKYILILVHIDHNKVDLGKNKYSTHGFIKAQQFTKDDDLRYGLNGTLWGKTHYFPYINIYYGYWSVVKTENNDDVIMIDSYYNRIKFYSGFIVCFGGLSKCGNFITNIRKNTKQYFEQNAAKIKKKEIAGTNTWWKQNKYYTQEVK